MLVYGEGYFSPSFDLTNWVLPPERSYATFDFDADMAALDDVYGVEVNAMDADLSQFAARGGKLILFHGWEDGLITPTDSIDYYQRIRADGRDRAAFARLFMAPGTTHCAGGPGANLFGQLADIPLAPDPSPDNDLLLALDRWAGGGAAPERVLGRGMRLPQGATPANGEVGSRPICAFPGIARYDGKGDPLNASSFRCSKAPIPRYERPAARYLR
jgi:feruloyl esterase